MIFWDSSAVVALIIDENDSSGRLALLQEDSQMVVWWGTLVEIESALQRRLREGSVDTDSVRVIRQRLTSLSESWYEVNPTSVVRKLALRLLRTHPLRAADSLQLAAALTLETNGSTNFAFACADKRLCAAAEIEGLKVV